MRFTATWGSREALELTLVVPELVAEVSAPAAVDLTGTTAEGFSGSTARRRRAFTHAPTMSSSPPQART
ncbi:hypothetical protein GCM10010207_65270 [Streptomyces atratus]|uniref:hypothetical protein n=1 Tax=Streptomyces atratus TaxID=1893 RepID=UPI00166F9272|nr:hypothetical protein [Streptomyces atratus]GGT56145.1 hypothetical protein GCM10010207_65270 [Streptomyces atratus]